MGENQKVTELLPSGQDVWIGFFRDSWKWSDGSNSSFRYWNEAAGEPNNSDWNEDCAAAVFSSSSSGKWEDWPCNWRRAFICYSVLPVSKKVVRVRLMKKSSSLDLNDPAVMEDILRQFKQKLKDEGVDGDVQLSWKKQSDGKVFHKEKETEKKTTKKKDEL
ncbi:aggrecan core protein-like protein [Lates japonicus]|uniref:Aggrecan core protein-like protein n=1 Tax=Lates japonicus TaxID=270547 RepID=A0AAD3RBL7_LATJO|nr:aggrecan core protein-like protein [Lates japonicus]